MDLNIDEKQIHMKKISSSFCITKIQIFSKDLFVFIGKSDLQNERGTKIF